MIMLTSLCFVLIHPCIDLITYLLYGENVLNHFRPETVDMLHFEILDMDHRLFSILFDTFEMLQKLVHHIAHNQLELSTISVLKNGQQILGADTRTLHTLNSALLIPFVVSSKSESRSNSSSGFCDSISREDSFTTPAPRGSRYSVLR